MKRILKINTVSLLLLLFSVKSLFAADDLFRIEIDNQNSSEITITCYLNPGYTPDNYECGGTYYLWDFGDGNTKGWFASDADSYISHTYYLDGSEASPFEKEITLLIDEQDYRADEEFSCGNIRYISEKEELSVNLYGCDLSVTLTTDPENNYTVGEPISFKCNVSDLNGTCTENLYYTISETTSTVSEEGEGSGGITSYNTEIDLDYSITAPVAATYIIELNLWANGEVIYTKEKTISIGENDGGDDDDGGGCPPAGTFGLSIEPTWEKDNNNYKIDVTVTCADEANYKNCFIYLCRYTYDDEGNKYKTDLIADPEGHLIPYSEKKSEFHYFGFYPFSDVEKKRVDYFLQVVDPDKTAYCFSSYINQTEWFEAPTLDPDDYNQVVIKNGLFLQTYLKECYAFSINDPNNPLEDKIWIEPENKKVDNLDFLGGSAEINLSGSNREAELRIYSDEYFKYPTLLIDKFGYKNTYRSVWITQESIISSDVNFEAPDGDGFPFSYHDPDAAYYGLFGSAWQNKYYVAEVPEIPIDMILENLNNEGEIIVNSYDRYGMPLEREKLSFKISDCSSDWDFNELTNYNLYVANINAPKTFSDFVYDTPTHTLVVAKDNIRFTPTSGDVVIRQGTSFTARIGDCITPKSTENKVGDLIQTERDTINNLSSNPEILIYPNPTEGQFTIEVIGSSNSIRKIEIHNKIGQLVFVKENDIMDVNTVDLQGWTSGIYFVRILYINGKIEVEKLIKE